MNWFEDRNRFPIISYMNEKTLGIPFVDKKVFKNIGQ